MATSALLLEVAKVVLPLLVGYLLRHWNVSIPGLPAPAAAAPSDHVTLLQSILGIGKTEAKAVLQDALQVALKKVLADASQAVQAPAQAPKS